MRIALVADKNTVTCFKLAGLRDVYAVKNADEARKHINQLLEESNLAIILVPDRLIDHAYSIIEKGTERKYPIIIPIPDTLGTATPKVDPIVELVRRKAGIEVKL